MNMKTGAVHFWCNFLGTKKTYKVEIQLLVGYSERRGRDSNPRCLAAQRFSRPPQSTTLPPLQRTKVQVFSLTTKYFCKNFSIIFYSIFHITVYQHIAALCDLKLFSPKKSLNALFIVIRDFLRAYKASAQTTILQQKQAFYLYSAYLHRRIYIALSKSLQRDLSIERK